MRNVELPRSKSVVAREAMIAALSGSVMPDGGGSADGDIVVKALGCDDEQVYVASSGTAARFVIAFYGSRSGVRIVDGSVQLRCRTIASVVNAMRSLGARIDYLGAEGHLPVRVSGCENIGREVEVDAEESSQTVSALMLIGAKRGLRIQMKGDIASPAYIELTKRVMERCGVAVSEKDGVIEVQSGEYRMCDDVGKDWSSAVFWYGRVAVGDDDEVLLNGLKMGSGQPDERAVALFGQLGVRSEETPDGVRVYRSGEVCEMMDENCKSCLDLVPVLAAAMCRMNIRFVLKGLHGLEGKECRRGSVMAREMRKLGYMLTFDGDKLSWKGEKCKQMGDADVADDHRIAMAVIVAGGKVNDTKCIDKSYRGLVL